MPASSNLNRWISSLPATDREIESQKAREKAASAPAAPPAKEKKKRPVSDESGASTFTGPEPDEAAKLCASVFAEGKTALQELVESLRDPGDPQFENYKAEYLLHCLVIYTGHPQHARQRALLAEVIAAGLLNEKLAKPVRAFLARELQWCGDQQVAPALGRLLADEELCSAATAALLAIREGAVAQFRAALPQAGPATRLHLLHALAALADSASLESFHQAAADPDREIRLVAAWGMAQVADPRSADLLLKLADAKAPWERVKATQACLEFAERLAARGQTKAAVTLYQRLRDTRTGEKEAYVRETIHRALSQLGAV